MGDIAEMHLDGTLCENINQKKGIKMKKNKFTDHETQLRKVCAIVATAVEMCVKLSKDEKDLETLLAIHKAAIISIAEHVKPIVAELAEEERVANEKHSK